MSWIEIDKRLKELSVGDIAKLVKGLHDLSPQNKAWLRAKLLPVAQDTKYLEDCRRKVANYVYKETKGMPSMPRFREAKKVISEYRKSTSDLRGALDLMLTYLERGHEFTLDFGDIDEPFYDKLINMLEHFAIELRRSPAKYELYEQFRPRLMAIRKNSDIGWGYGDFIQETVDELEKLLGENL
ncbi:MAG: hypothetical protein IPM31_14320 [Anaerolineae bacterium]|nr:hypothetical protein [Anaerolineae bacterium]MBL8107053.1 hypothetical protein [Anaerolineales bacterium]MCC7191012.1 hypothetical protein [Anaerolineales bacterium]